MAKPMPLVNFFGTGRETTTPAPAPDPWGIIMVDFNTALSVAGAGVVALS